MEKATVLRKLLAEPELLLVPGVFDAHSARHAAQAGFKTIYLSGSAIAMSQFGYPDIGLVTMSETIEQLRRVTAAVEVPVVVDMDTGFGNAVNVLRTVREAEAAGAAAVQIEDQVFPKRCGHFEGKEVITPAEMIGKIKAAVNARRGDLVIIGRTDARAVTGLEDAIDRGRAYAEAGADVVFIEAPQSREEMVQITRSVSAPLLLNIVEGGKTPQLSMAEAQEIGFKIILYPTACIRAVAQTLKQLYQTLRTQGTTGSLLDQLVTFQERNQITGLAWYDEWAKRFGSS
jgi:2-methylisocitrate lyase-like PEP mutase family enzyme